MTTKKNRDLDVGSEMRVDYLPVTLAYHKVDSRIELGLTRTTPDQFLWQMRYLKDNGYRSITLNQLQKHISGEEKLGPKSVLITFDDGYLSLKDFAFPVLKELGFTAVVFLITDYIGTTNDWDVHYGWIKFRHLDWEDIYYWNRNGIEFQAHTATHPDLSNLSEAELKSELLDSKVAIESNLNCRVIAFSYPFARYNEKVREIANSVGYEFGFTFFPMNGNNGAVDGLTLPRKPIYLIDGKAGFKAKVESERYPILSRFENWKGRVINRCAVGTPFILKLLNNSISHSARP